MRRALRVVLAAAYPAVLTLLTGANLLAFLDFQNPGTPVQGSISYAPLRARYTDVPPPALVPNPLLVYPRLQSELMGAELIVPRGVQLDAWSWKHLVLATLRYEDVDVVLHPTLERRLRTMGRSTALSRGEKVLVPASAAGLRDRPAYLMRGAKHRTLYVVPEAELRALHHAGPEDGP